MTPALPALQQWLSQNGYDAFILPRGDAYLGEYVAAADELLAHLTGFTGSAGFALVTRSEAVLYTDGRYQTQGEAELRGTGFALRHSGKDAWHKDLIRAAGKGGKLAYDPWLHSMAWLKETLGHLPDWQLVEIGQNPVAAAWADRPAPPPARAENHPLQFAGENSADKCARLAALLVGKDCAAEFINDPTLVMWLLNLRGRDVPHTPVAQCRAMLHADGRADLFIAPEKLPAGLDAHIMARAPSEMREAFAALHGKSILLPPANTPVAVMQMAEAAGAVIERGAGVVMPARATKNATEIAGTRAAHARDAAAVKKFLAELPSLITRGVTEYDLADVLAQHRAAQGNGYVMESFPAIIGWQGNGAIVHYRAPETGSAKISGNGILLIDSGGQYLDGTTDITRTVAIGTPTPRQREVYTRVLRGHLAIARAVFPAGTTGHQLDALARQYLWEAGLDYDHGTGHGVGSFLSVHEGPQSISMRHNPTALQAGMILSNEPGCYLPGEFGVRIENLVLVIPAAHSGFLQFATLTHVPYDTALIDENLLTTEELAQIRSYQESCLAA